MEPFSALAVATAVVQFVDYGSKILKNAAAIYSDASSRSQEEIDTRAVTETLQVLLNSLSSSSLPVPTAPTQQEAAEELLRARCEQLARELVEAFGTHAHQSRVQTAGRSRRAWLSFGHAVRLMWKKEDIQNLQQRLRYLKDQLHLTISAHVLDQVTSMRYEIALHIDEARDQIITRTQELIFQLSQSLSKRTTGALIVIVLAFALHFWRSSSTQRQRDLVTSKQLQTDIANWLSPLEYSQKQNDLIDLRYPGTGEWFLESTKFNDWLVQSNQTLLLEGIPGAGKTILVSTTINFLQQTYPAPNHAICYAYCDYRNLLQQTPEQIVSALLKQLVRSIPLSSQTILLHDHHTKLKDRPKLNELATAFRHESGRYSSVFLVIDALDECFDKTEVTAKLLQLLFTLAPHIKLLVSSRPHINTSHFLPNIQHVVVAATDLDLQKYVEARLSPATASDLARVVQDHRELREDIVHTVVKKANGMFLLAQLHMDLLAGKTSVRSIRRALADLPVGLAEAHHKALSRVENQAKDARELAVQVFGFLSYAFRPVTVNELQNALAAGAGSVMFDEEGIVDRQYILTVCVGLVVIENEANIIRFVHYSTQEYFKGIRETVYPDGHAKQALACLTFLSMSEFANTSCSTLDEVKSLDIRRPFYAYAATFWGDHARGSETTLKDEILRFLMLNHQAFCSVQAKISYEAGRRAEWDILRQPVSPLWVVASFGLPLTTNSLLQQGVDVNMKPFYGMRDIYADTPLQRASDAGHTAVVRLLLQRGADPNDRDGEHENSLKAAVYHGHTETVQVLLDAGALPDPPFGLNMGSPLALASYFGYEEIAKLLLDKGADMHYTGGDQTSLGSALQAACSGGHESIVRILLARGADVRLPGGSGFYSIVKAKKRGDDRRIGYFRRMALEGIWRSRDYPEQFRLQATDCESPLHCAAFHGHVNIARLLLDAGADVNNPGDLYGTPLQEASATGKQEMVQYLISAGAFVNAPGIVFGDALHAASLYGHCDVVELLLDNGANVKGNNPMPFIFNSPYQAAMSGGHTATARLLLSRYLVFERPFIWLYSSIWFPLMRPKLEQQMKRRLRPNWV